MRATLLLADYAVVANNKLTIVGGGWTTTGPEPQQFAIALKPCRECASVFLWAIGERALGVAVSSTASDQHGGSVGRRDASRPPPFFAKPS